MSFVELRQDELQKVEGGIGPTWWVLMTAAIAVAAAVNTVYDAGKNFGEFLYTVTH